MKPGRRNAITDVEGLRVGQAQDAQLKSGVTVLAGDAPFVAGVHVMGGAPGTRETDLLAADKTVREVDALVLSGGSAFGLAACDGVAAAMRAEGRGFAVGAHKVPIVPGAILFDLMGGGDHGWEENPYPALGRAAYGVLSKEVALGSVGAGTGATTAGFKGGVGTASTVLSSGHVVGALVAVNALGSAVVDDGPVFWAGAFEEGDEFGAYGVGRPQQGWRTKMGPGENTTIAIIATDADLDPAGATRLAVAAHDGMARALVPSHTPMDGDLVFSAATGAKPAGPEDLLALGHAGATCLARAIARGVFAARAAPGDVLPSWHERHGAGR